MIVNGLPQPVEDQIEPISFSCSICDKAFANRVRLKQRESRVHGICNLARSLAKGTICIICHTEYHTRTRLIRDLQHSKTSCLDQLCQITQPVPESERNNSILKKLAKTNKSKSLERELFKIGRHVFTRSSERQGDGVGIDEPFNATLVCVEEVTETPSISSIQPSPTFAILSGQRRELCFHHWLQYLPDPDKVGEIEISLMQFCSQCKDHKDLKETFLKSFDSFAHIATFTAWYQKIPSVCEELADPNFTSRVELAAAATIETIAKDVYPFNE